MTLAGTVRGAVSHWARVAPEHEAVADSDRRLTFGQLEAETACVRDGLAAQGVRCGDRVALGFGNSVDFVVAALACLDAGAAFVPLAIGDPPERLRRIVRDCRPRVVVSDGPPDLGVATVALEQLRAGGRRASRARPTGELAYLIYTSGTTGEPKGVAIGQRAFTAAIGATIAALGLGPTTRALTVSPFHFDGSFGTLFPTLAAGGSVVLRPRDALLFPRTFVNAVLDERVTYTGFSPSYLRVLLSSRDLSRIATSDLDVIALGGEAASAGDIERLRAILPRVRIVNRYGPTETTIAVTHHEVRRGLGTGEAVPIGRPHPGTEFHLVRADGSVIEDHDEIGELHIAGDQLMTGYWDAPDLTARALRRDVVAGALTFRTGDLAVCDAAGNYVHVDRVDRVLKRSGVRISLVELTRTVRSLEGVDDATCVRFDDDEGRVGIAAFTVAQGVGPADLQAAVRAILPASMVPDRFELVDALPLTRSGKVDEVGLLSSVGLAARAPSARSCVPHHPARP